MNDDTLDPVLALIGRACQKASKGRTTHVAHLTGRERRSAKRFLERHDRRLSGVYPVGAVQSALCHRIGG